MIDNTIKKTFLKRFSYPPYPFVHLKKSYIYKIIKSTKIVHIYSKNKYSSSYHIKLLDIEKNLYYLRIFYFIKINASY